MKLLIRTAFVIYGAFTVVIAEARVYQHVDPQTGAITFSNIPPRGYEPEAQAKPQASPPDVVVNSMASVPALVPANFPRVAPETQKSRDADRLKILNAELLYEQVAFEAAVTRNAETDTVRRHKENIAALRREISKMK